MPDSMGYSLLSVEERQFLRDIAHLVRVIESIGDDTPLPFPPGHPSSPYTNYLRRRMAVNLFDVRTDLYQVALDKKSVWDAHHADPRERWRR